MEEIQKENQKITPEPLENNKPMNSSKIKFILIGLIIYVFSAFASFMLFSNTTFIPGRSATSPVPEEAKKTGEERFVVDETLPKTEACPLNGVLYAKAQKEWWQKHRPLGVMIENHKEARPQSGLYYSDVIYEAVAEGGITRFLSIYYCQDAGIVGPVRSARTYFLDFISEYGNFPLYAHVGGANTPGPADALSQIEKYGWGSYNDLNQFSIGFPTFWRDYERFGREVATEHTMYSATGKLWAIGEKRGLTNVDKKGDSWDSNFIEYKFKEDPSDRPLAQSISFEFWKGYSDFAVGWDYDKATNTYLRSTGGQKHMDKDNNKQLFAKNVVILYMLELNANDGYEDNLHLLYQTKGSGKALVFQDGKEVLGTWTKKDRTSRLILKDTKGKEIDFTRGKIWFEVLPNGTNIVVK